MNQFRLLPLVFAACLTTPVRAAERYVIDFRTTPPGAGIIRHYGPHAATMLKTDDFGLRVTVPAERTEPYADIGVEIPVRIHGDFEISVGYELLSVGEPIPEFGAGVKLRVDFESPAPLAASITRLRKPPAADKSRVFDQVGANGESFGAVRVTRGGDGNEKLEVRNFRAASNKGRLTLVRVGSQLQFRAQDGGTEHRQIRTLDFGTSDVAIVRAFASTGYRRVATEVRLTDLTFETQTPPLAVVAAPAADATGRAEFLTEQPTEFGSSAASWFALALLVLASGVGVLVIRRKRAAVQNSPAASTSPIPIWIVVALITVIFGCSIHANRSFAVKDGADYRFFPPFKPHANANMNNHLGAEYFLIAKALAAGDGFADPFPLKTGPTAWMAPVLPMFEASVLWLCGGNRETLMGVIVFCQVYALIATGLLVLAVARRSVNHVWSWAALAIYLGAVIGDFHAWFQMTHDHWLVLLAVDMLVAAVVWSEPMRNWKTAAGWGLIGGFCALVSPIVGFLWGALTLFFGVRGRAWSRIAIAAVVAGLAIAPWTLRNYVVFGRLIPVKSNAAYELYQSQCLQPDGLIQLSTFAQHPYRAGSREGQEYKELGEVAFLDRKREQFWEAVRADPRDFFGRVGDRLLGTTVWYTPFDRNERTARPLSFWTGRVLQPLPFLAMLVLLATAMRRPLHPIQWAVIGIYVLYLLPYIALSYYNRYGFPLLGVKVLLVIWAVDRLVALRPRRRAAVATKSAPVKVASRAKPKPVGVPA